MARNFSKVVLVKINRKFEASRRLIFRKPLPRARGTKLEQTYPARSPPDQGLTSSSRQAPPASQSDNARIRSSKAAPSSNIRNGVAQSSFV